MDLTPQLFRDVQFTERRGAYDKDEVHAFLARVGTAVGQMQERVRDAQRRVEASEEHVSKLEAAAREARDADETLRRTLVLAQRTADAAIKEAQDEAEAIVADARGRADEMVLQAEETVRRDVGATRDRLEAEIRELERQRNELNERIVIISDHLTSERARLRAELDELKEALDDPSKVVMAPAPGSDAEPVTDGEPVIVLPDARRSNGAALSAAPALDTDLDDDVPEDAAGLDAESASDDLSHLPPPPEDWAPSSSPEPELATDPTSSSGSLFDPPGDDDLADTGPATEATPVISAGSNFGGSHLEELRRAVSDESADSEADAAMAAFFDQDTDDDEPSRRFGRRR